MTLHVITVYHNTSGRFGPYASGHGLVGVISHWHHQPEGAELEQIADWIFHLLNVDLEDLHSARANSGGESAFLLACSYRLLGLRSMATGDVLALTVGDRTTWLACEPIGWRRISAPTVPLGSPTDADAVRQRLRETRRG